MDGTPLKLRLKSAYPWGEEIELQVVGEGEFSVFLRLPDWCERDSRIEINGQPAVERINPGSYAEIRRKWQSGDRILLVLPMPIRQVASHPFVDENLSRVALARGPLIYCLEQEDHTGIDLRSIALDHESNFEPIFRDDLFGGIVVLHGSAREFEIQPAWGERLYQTVGRSQTPLKSDRVSVTAIPYFAWANRNPGAMQVWIRSIYSPA